MKYFYVLSKEKTTDPIYYFNVDTELSNLEYAEEYVLRFKPNIKSSNLATYSININTNESPYVCQLGMLIDQPFWENQFKVDSNGNYDTNYEYHFISVMAYGTTPVLYFTSSQLINEGKENNNMACNNSCQYFHYVTGASIVSGSLILTLNDTPELIDKNNFCFRFGCNIAIPTGASALPVYISINSVSYPLWDKFGDIMLGSELIPTTSGVNYCPRFTYHGYVGAQTSGEATTTHIIVHNIPRAYCKVYLN